ncbi:MAG: urease accessory protein UreF [Deltaproteobacteria bacterium]|nr:urease accessory protein UreF [Deltaproteobacteria bacterium]
MATARLLRLASPALPIGAFAWSSGLEAAIEAGVVTDEDSAEGWLGDALELSVARWEAPVLWRLLHHTPGEDWNAVYLAARETRELRAETLQTGAGLWRLLESLGETRGIAPPHDGPSLPWAWACAARVWAVAPAAALSAWIFAWVENQLAVLMKALPLGQVASQRLLSRCLPRMARAQQLGQALPDDELSSMLPGLALLSSHHETQYSRLFRS